MSHNWIARGLGVLLAMVVIVSGAFAGGSQEETEKELVISRWAGPHADDTKDVVRQYGAADIVVDDIDFGSLRQRHQTSFQAASGRGSYDAVWVANQWMQEYVDAGYIIAIDDMAAEHGVDLSMYAAGLLEGAQFGGSTYGLPTFAQTLILAYDSEAFEEAGLEPPTTSDELVDVARYFKEHEGTGIAVPAQQGGAAVNLYSQLLFSQGAYYFDDDGNLDLMSDESIYAATTYQQLVEYSVDGTLTWHHDETAEAVRMQNAPIGTVMSGLANQFADPERSLIVDTVEYAGIAGPDGHAAGNNNFWVWAIPANAPDPDASFQFISWLTSADTEKEMTLLNQQISAVTSIAEDPEVRDSAPFLPVVMEVLANGRSDPASANFLALREELIVGLSEIASTDADPATVLQGIQDGFGDVDFSE